MDIKIIAGCDPYSHDRSKWQTTILIPPSENQLYSKVIHPLAEGLPLDSNVDIRMVDRENGGKTEITMQDGENISRLAGPTKTFVEEFRAKIHKFALGSRPCFGLFLEKR